MCPSFFLRLVENSIRAQNYYLLIILYISKNFEHTKKEEGRLILLNAYLFLKTTAIATRAKIIATTTAAKIP